MASESLQKVFNYIDENKQKLIDHLAECVSIPSVSAWPEKRPDIQKMMDHVANIIEDLGGSVEKCDIGKQTLADGSEIPLPTVLLGLLTLSCSEHSLIVSNYLHHQINFYFFLELLR